jgi:16S rRNA G966 N2-methylase RsmD
VRGAELLKHIDHALVETTRPQAYKAWLYWGKKPPNIVRSYIGNYCSPGGVVLDPFVGSGVTALEAAASGRRAIGIDLNPVGLFLAEDLARPVDLDDFDVAVARLDPVLAEIDELLTTEQRCNNCKREFSAPAVCCHWKDGAPFAMRVTCPRCKHIDTYEPTSSDLVTAREYESQDKAGEEGLWTPKVSLGYSPTTPFIKVGGNVAPQLRDYFTGRNWYSLARLRAVIVEEKDTRLRHAMLAMLATITHLSSAMMMVRKTRPGSSSLARQAYWLPGIFMESNVADLVRRARGHHQGYRAGQEDANRRFKAIHVYRSVEDLLASDRPGIRFICESALDIERGGRDQIPDESIDYIFTDPPYGGAIQYMEMFTLWQGWLSGPGAGDLPMRYDEEITVNDAQGKDTLRYNQLMTAAFNQCYRVLKPKRWMHVTFHHTDVSTFTSIVVHADHERDLRRSLAEGCDADGLQGSRASAQGVEPVHARRDRRCEAVVVHRPDLHRRSE